MAADIVNFPLPMEASRLGRLLFLSPHLDDAAFACGRLLASVSGAIVATVFTGAAPAGSALTEWDRASGFQPGDDVLARRKQEDRQALALLGASPRWLGLPDRQYGAAAPLADVVAELLLVMVRDAPDGVFFPLGLFHSDHQLTRQASLVLLPAFAGCRWFAYEDALYRRLPGLREEALATLLQAGLTLSPTRFTETADAAQRKCRAVAFYQSQLRALGTPGRPGNADLAEAEAYWQVHPAGAGRP